MKNEVSKQKGQVTFKFAITEKEWEEYINSAYNQTKKKYKVQGFRPGHAPRKAIEMNYGPTIFFDDAFNDCAQACYTKALASNKDVEPVDSPKVDVTKFAGDGKGMEFTMTVITKPEVTLGEYTGIKLTKVEYAVSDADVKKVLVADQERGARTVDITDRAVKDGDTVNLDYSGSVKGKKFDGGTAEAQTLTIGSNTFIPGFEEQMVGMTIGESKDLKVKFPDEYHSEDLKGKDAVFAVKVNSISAKELPELNDEFVKDTTKFETLKEYKEDIKARLTSENEKRTLAETQNKVIDAVIGNAKVDVPECMVDEELDYMLEEFEHRLQHMYQGLKLDDYFKYTNSSRDDYKKQSRPEALKTTKTRLVMQAIVKKEKLEATAKDVDKKLTEYAKANGKKLEDIKGTVDERGLAQLRNEVTSIKIMDYLMANNEFEVKAGKSSSTVKKTTASTTKKATSTTAKKTTTKKATEKSE